MPLAAGQTLSFYEILGPLGAGGMGEVWRARDTRLEREVAIKVLPDELAGDEERLRRFEREAKTLAALHHPNVASIFGIDQQDGTCFLALELVEGEDLAARLARGRLATDEAVEVCRQIAEGLEAAHEAGIVHRDLKPANVRVTPAGVVKVLDFGLAKPVAIGRGRRGGSTVAETDSVAMTEEGTVLGTPTYMSPEQARGKAVDRRTDIWAFGCVLYECLTGRRAFGGESLTDVLSAVVSQEPDWSRLDGVPAQVASLVRRCLVKDPRRRLRDVGEARLVLAGETVDGEPRERPVRRGLVWPVLAGVLATALVASLWTREPAPDGTASRHEPSRCVDITFAPDETLDLDLAGLTTPLNALGISPDGMRLVYHSQAGGIRGLRLRELDAFESRPILGTENGFGPFFSPDGSVLGFFADSKLKRLPLGGGSPGVISTAPAGRGGAWLPDDTIVFSPAAIAGLWIVDAEGGERTSLDSKDEASGEIANFLARPLPGGESVIYTAWVGGSISRIVALVLATHERKVLVEDANNAFYVASGHLVFGRRDEIWSAPFDAERMEVTGPAVRRIGGVWNGGFHSSTVFVLSDSGDLVYAPVTGETRSKTVVWVDREGKETEAIGEKRSYSAPRLSPDASRILFRSGEGTSDIWLYEIERGLMTRLTAEGYDDGPNWSPDGRSVIFSTTVDGVPNLVRMAPASGATPELLWKSEFPQFGESISRDGKTICVAEMNPVTGMDVLLLDADGGKEPRPFARTNAPEYSGSFSPDGTWIAFVSGVSGRSEIYVRALRDGSGDRQISIEGGTEPFWSHDGREIFYRQRQKMMVVEVELGADGDVSLSRPRELFSGPYEVLDGPVNYDVTPDGRRFLMVKFEQDDRLSRLRLITSWGSRL